MTSVAARYKSLNDSLVGNRLPKDKYYAVLEKKGLLNHHIKQKKLKADARAPPRAVYARAPPKRRAPAAAKRSYNTVSGRGEYKERSAKDPRDPYKQIDLRSEYAFEPDYGKRLGSVLGEGFQSFAHALGLGDYSIEENSLMGMIDLGTSPPMVRNTKKGEATIISHREFLSDLVTPSFTGDSTNTPFNITSYQINAGNNGLFPFLAPLAASFQEYELRGMLLELKSTSSELSTSLALGSMFAATCYDSLTPAPTNKQQLENMEYAVSSKPSCSMIMPIECKRENNVLQHLYVAVDGQYEPTSDPRFYDLGTLFIGSQGIPAENAPIAEIWITYEVALYKPILPSQSHVVADGLSLHWNIFGATTADPFFGALAFGTTVIKVNPSTITFPNVTANYLVVWNVNTTATTGSFTTGVVWTGTGVNLRTDWSTPTNNNYSQQAKVGPAQPISSVSGLETLASWVLNIVKQPGTEGIVATPVGHSFNGNTFFGDLFIAQMS